MAFFIHVSGVQTRSFTASFSNDTFDPQPHSLASYLHGLRFTLKRARRIDIDINRPICMGHARTNLGNAKDDIRANRDNNTRFHNEH